MKRAEVYRNGRLTGQLVETDQGRFSFCYDDDYFTDPSASSISLTIPKSQKEHVSEILFPFFFNMLSEGVNRKLQCRRHQLDENDFFGLLLATASDDTIGAITIKRITE